MIDEDHKEIYEMYEQIITTKFNQRDQASLRKMAKQESLQDDQVLLETSSPDLKDDQLLTPTGNRIVFLDCKEGVTTCTILSMFGVFFTNFAFSSYIFFILIFLLEDPDTYNLTPEIALS